jgi:hypothetical protein
MIVPDKPNFGRPPSFEEQDKLRFAEVRQSIKGRLTKACSHLSAEDFDALVEKMARVQVGKRL